MPKKSTPPPEKKPTRRQPLKRQKLGGLTITLQRAGSGFMVAVHHPDGKRTRQRCATEGEGKTTFDLRCREAARQGVEVAATLDDADRRAVADFITKTSTWHPRPSVADVLAEYIKRHESRSASITVEDAIVARLDEARARGLSSRHVNSTESRLKPFKEKYGSCPLSDITTREVQSFINELPVSPTSKGDALRAVHSVFSTAIRSGRVSVNPAAPIRPPKSVDEEVGTITAAELERLLAALPKRSVPAVAIMALGGLRRAEAERLEWRHVKLGDNFITVSAGVAKTASRRHVPINEALAAWLRMHAKETGRVAPAAMTFRRDLEAARLAAKIDGWPRNALRHGAISAWAALESDLSKVAAWAGNSPDIIHKHYRALWTPEQGRAWLAVAPPAAAKRKSTAKGRKPAPSTPETSEAAEAASGGQDETLGDIIEFPKAAAS